MGFFKDVMDDIKKTFEVPIEKQETDEEKKEREKKYNDKLVELFTCPKCGYSGEENYTGKKYEIDQLTNYPKKRFCRTYNCQHCDHSWISNWSRWYLFEEEGKVDCIE